MTPKPLDIQLSELVALARRMGDERLVIYVSCDGRVDMFGENPPKTHWTLHADVAVGSALPLPSDAIKTLRHPGSV